MGWLDLWFDTWMMCLAHNNYAVGDDAEADQVSKYFGKVAVSYPPPLVLNVEPASDSHRFPELVINTAGGHLHGHTKLRTCYVMIITMPAIAGPRKTVWPSLCASLDARSEHNSPWAELLCRM